MERGAARRPALLDAAVAVFVRYGFRRASMNEVAREAGLSRAALYLHFTSKEALFRALVVRLHDEALAQAEAAARRAGSLAERLAGIVEAKAIPLFTLLRSAAHAAEFVDENHRLCGDVSARAAEAHGRLLARCFRDADRAGEIDLRAVGLTADTAAGLLIDAVEGLKTRAPAGTTPEQLRKRLAQLLRVFVAGLRPVG